MDNYGYANSENKQFCELLADGCLLLLLLLLLLLQFTTAAEQIYVHNAYCILQFHQQKLPVPPSPSAVLSATPLDTYWHIQINNNG